MKNLQFLTIDISERQPAVPDTASTLRLMISHDWECDVLNAESLSRSLISDKQSGRGCEATDYIRREALLRNVKLLPVAK